MSVSKALAGGRYALIGAGQLGRMSLALWPASVAQPEFILDSNKSGRLGGIEIRNLGSHVREPDITYLASVFTIPPREIRDIFRRIGQPEIVTVYDLFEEFAPSVFSNGWRNLEPCSETQRRLAHMPQLYADELSRKNCEAVTAWRYRRELLDDYPIGPHERKYDLRYLGRAGTHYDVVYDCGSFDFSFADWLGSAEVTFDKVVAFEPDPESHAICEGRISDRRLETDAEILLRRQAVSDRKGRGAFLANGQLAARLVSDPLLEHPDLIDVEICTLDDVHEELFGWEDAPATRVLIKLHVEGAELKALKGAEKVIRTSRADILLNVSHDEASYLDIPEMLSAFGFYDLILRSHALFGEGMTLFARRRP